MYVPVDKKKSRKKALTAIAILLLIFTAVPILTVNIVNAVEDHLIRTGQLSDFDHMIEILERQFPYFPLIYRRTGIDMLALAPEVRAKIEATRPAMSNEEFEGLLNYNFFRYAQFVGHLSILRPLNTRLGPTSEENITTNIIEEGRIAYISIGRMWARGANLSNNNFDPLTDTCFEIVDAFLEEIIDFEHLIIDIRGNPGGWPQYFYELLVSPLITRRLAIQLYHFYNRTDSFYLGWHIPEPNTRVRASIGYGYGTGSTLGDMIDLENLAHYVIEDLMAFNARFIQAISVTPRTHTRAFEPPPDRFDGNVWLLVDGRVISAAQEIATFAKESGFATLVGEITGGVPNFAGVNYLIYLPNTNLHIRFDPTYILDPHGRPLEYGTIPHHFNRPGMDALETVLALIAEEDY